MFAVETKILYYQFLHRSLGKDKNSVEDRTYVLFDQRTPRMLPWNEVRLASEPVGKFRNKIEVLKIGVTEDEKGQTRQPGKFEAKEKSFHS